ncbi:MAG: zinc ribbon domain-containing protein [Desulfobacterales bacterium]|nr:zinc ribbon domain-containing protein [Desulfobacterales bacterium]
MQRVALRLSGKGDHVMAEKAKVDERFKKFGTVSFTSLTKTNDFIDYLEKGKIAGTRCKDCGKVFFPPRADCFQCLASNMEWFEVTGSGKLVSFSKLEYGPAGFQDGRPLQHRPARLRHVQDLRPHRQGRA